MSDGFYISFHLTSSGDYTFGPNNKRFSITDLCIKENDLRPVISKGVTIKMFCLYWQKTGKSSLASIEKKPSEDDT